jgi:hypothetical protein
MDVKRHNHIYDDLLKLDIQLNFQDVPAPSYIQELIIKCNTYQLRVERYFIEVTRDLAVTERMYTTEKLDLDMLTRNTLTNNEKIKKIPTGKEREAAVGEMLEDNHRNLLKLENDVNDLKSILSAIRQKQGTLKSTNNDIKSLQKLMEQQINRLNIGHPDDPEIRHMSDGFKELDELEKEFELDEVESSVEISQSDESKGVVEDDSVEFSVPDDLGESVAQEGSDTLDELLSVGDEPGLESIPTDTQDTGSQIEEDIGEITRVSDALNPADDIEDELASLLTEDESGAYQPEDEDREEREQTSVEESVVENDSVASTVESVETPDIEIDDEIESDVDSRVSEPPKLEVDLSDLGIDLDFGDDIPEAPKSTPRTKETKPTKEPGTVKADVKKSEDPPVQKSSAESKKPEAKKVEVVDIDLDDILNQL